MNLTINDFRRVLGDVNDGDVVFTRDQSGIEKANHGNSISRLFHDYRQVTSNPAENWQIRQLLLDAILNSPEGRLLEGRQYEALVAMIGGRESTEVLSRKTLKAVLDTVELMVRGEDVPADNVNISTRIRGIPNVESNLLVAAQVNELKRVGYDPDKYESIIGIVKDHTQTISGLMSEKNLGKLFDKGFLGHSPKEMRIFVQESAAHIQSQIFDKLLWKYIDALENNPNPGQRVELESGPMDEVFKSVLEEMMATYAEKKSPGPKTDKMLMRQDLMKSSVGEVVKLPSLGDPSGQLAIAGTSFLKKAEGRLADVLNDGNEKFKSFLGCLKQSKADFSGRQVGNFITQLKNVFTEQMDPLKRLKGQSCQRMYQTYIDAYNNTQGVADTKQEAAEQAVNDFLNGLDLKPVVDSTPIIGAFGGCSKELLKKFSGSEMISSYVFQTIAAKIEGRQSNEVKALEDKTIVRMVSETIDEVVSFGDALPLAQALARQLGKDPDNEVEVGKIADILKHDRGVIAEFTVAAQVKLAETRIANGNADPQSVATAFLSGKGDFVILVGNKLLGDGEGVKLMQQAKNAVYAEIGRFKENGGDLPKKGLEKLLKEKKPEIGNDEIEITRGKLLIALYCGLIDKRPEIKVRLVDPRNPIGYLLTSENLQTALDVAEELLAEYSHTDLKAFERYVTGGDRDKDEQLGPSNTWRFRDLYLDGRFDFTGADSKTQNYLADSIYEEWMGLNNNRIDLDVERHMPDGVFDAYYRELRQAVADVVAKVNRNGKTKLDLAEVLEKSGLSDVNPPGAEKFDRFMRAYFKDNAGGNRFSILPFKKIYGFGTNDPKVQNDMLGRVGLKPADLNRPDGWMKAHRLMLLVRMHEGRAAGVLEWAERVFGKPFDQMTFSDLIEKAAAIETKVAIHDPADDLKGDKTTIAKFLGGGITLSEAKLMPEEMPAALAGLRNLAKSGTAKVEVVLFGHKVEFEKLRDGALTAKLADDGKGKAMPLGVSHTLSELIMLIENRIVEHADKFSYDQLKEVLPPPKETDVIARPREMYLKTLSTLLGRPSVNFAHLSTEALYAKLVEVARADKNGRPVIAQEFDEAPTTYNCAEMVELQRKYLNADSVDRALVRMPNDAKRNGVHDFLAELVMNTDTWAYDEGMKKPGQRVLSLIRSYGKLIGDLADNSDLMKTLPEFLRADIGKIIDELKKVVDMNAGNDKDRLDACEKIEKAIGDMVTGAMEKMQQKASALFGVSVADDRNPWQKSLDELNGSNGLSSSTSQGRFNKKLLDNYFVRCDPIEKRAMLANLIRNTDATSSEGKQVGEMLKGAGPLLQKTLQGLSASTFGPETQIALKDMKSKLLPIPDSVIKAQLLELVRSSDGEILSVEVKKSLGQATVGQALLCHIRTKEHPIVGEDVVIKILRPNVQTAVQREYKVFLDIARELDETEHTGNSQQETFKGRYQTVLKEFDFTLESTNIDLCMGVYDQPYASFGAGEEKRQYKTIHSMDRYHGVSPMPGAIVLRKVEGEPLDRMLEATDKRVEAIVKNIKKTTQAGVKGGPVTVYQAQTPGEAMSVKLELWKERRVLLEKHAELRKLVDVWLEKALFGDGVFHNDLHPGNVMMKDFDVSVIDFGNVGRLSKDQQAALVYMFAGAMSGTVEDFLAGVEKVMGKKLGDNVRTRLADTIKVTFSKGTSDDVLPRMLGALSALKDFSVPIPEVIHNFAESMSRLQTVVDGVVDEIEKIENISDEIVFDDKWLENTRLGEAYDGVGIDFLGDLKNLVKFIGTPGKKFDPEAAKGAATAYQEKVDGQAFKEQCEEKLKNVVFAMEDGGVGYLKEVIGVMQRFPAMIGRQRDFGGHLVIKKIESCTERFERLVAAYDKDRNENPQNAINRRDELVREFRELFRSFALNLVTNDARYGKDELCTLDPVISKPSNADNFVRCVGRSLAEREELVVDSLRRYMGIEEKKFQKVMGLFSSGNIFDQLKAGSEAGRDIGKFRSLKAVKDKISDAREAKDKFATRLGAVKDMPLAAGGVEKVGKRLSNQVLRKIERCANEFRYPLAWGEFKNRRNAKQEIEKAPEEIRLVFKTNLDALKKRLGVAQLDDVQIKYFARVCAASTRDLNFSEFLGDCDEIRLQELANGSEELEAMLRYYRDGVASIN